MPVFDALHAVAISIHASREGSDLKFSISHFSLMLFQSTLPAREATFEACAVVVYHNFNPRFPRGKRRASKVSAWAYFAFQSTLPAREATLTPLSAAAIHGFQSTLPAREATLGRLAPVDAQRISIHASREGSDDSPPFAQSLFLYFNPRFPRGKRLQRPRGRLIQKLISIHASREGSDGDWNIFEGQVFISIHASREGSDIFFLLFLAAFRAISIHASREGSDSQSPLSGGREFLFQSTLPAREATEKECTGHLPASHFNPRFPRGKRQFPVALNAIGFSISIHASREGSDHAVAEQTVPAPEFQSTLPAREATHMAALSSQPSPNFNPRFPRGKRRITYAFNYKKMDDFNPRFPRGKRRYPSAAEQGSGNFNPRFPRGKRRAGIIAFSDKLPISIHASREGSDQGGF